MISSTPTAEDHKEAEFIWASIQNSETLPPMLINLIAEKNLLKRNSIPKKRPTEDSPNIPTKKVCTPATKKKKFEKWAKALVREAPKLKFWYHEGGEKNCIVKETSAMTFEEFEDLFGGCGKNIAKSPKAVIQSRQYDNLEELRKLFGNVLPEMVQVRLWKKRAFGKSSLVDELDSPILGMIAKYNRTKMTVEMSFRLEVVM